jgi:uncharacterized protein (UPF0303 family)
VGGAEVGTRVVVRAELDAVRLAHPPDGEAVYERHILDRRRFAAHGGAFPLRVEGVGTIGTVVVSGLPQVQDHAFIVEMLEAHLASEA